MKSAGQAKGFRGAKQFSTLGKICKILFSFSIMILLTTWKGLFNGQKGTTFAMGGDCCPA